MSSRRGYLSKEELEQYVLGLHIKDDAEADDQISQAEELIDAYAGFQDKFLCEVVTGRATAGTTTTIELEQEQKNSYDNDFFTFTSVEIIGGTNAGQIRKVLSSTKAGVLTTEEFTDAIDDTSFYRIYQLGKFPRRKDAVSHNDSGVTTWYKYIPEEVRRATAAQMEFMIQMGPEFFAGDKTDMKREKIGDYEYEKDSGSLTKNVAPKARRLLNGIMRRIGQFSDIVSFV